jgi:hypothetical protein
MPEDDEYNAKPEEASIFALAQLGCTHPELDKRTRLVRGLEVFGPERTPFRFFPPRSPLLPTTSPLLPTTRRSNLVSSHASSDFP